MIQDPGDTAVRWPHRQIRKGGRVPPSAKDDPRLSVEMRDDAYDLPLRLFFADMGPGAPLIGLEIGDEDHLETRLSLTQVKHVARQLPLYERYARAVIQIYSPNGPTDVGLALEVINEVGATRRGKGARFYRLIGDEYSTLVTAGDPAPVMSIAEAHGVHKSTAFRWVKQARQWNHVTDADRGA